MTWGVSTAPRRPGELLTRGDVCHLHADRDGAERERVRRGDAGRPDDGRRDLRMPAADRLLLRAVKVQAVRGPGEMES